MKLIKPSVNEWVCDNTLEDIWKHIAACTRVCYQSEPRGNGETDEEFVKRVVLRNHSFEEIANSRDLQLSLHLSTLEHGTCYFNANYWTNDNMDKLIESTYSNIAKNTWSRRNLYKDKNGMYTWAITTNMRFLVENGLTNLLSSLVPPTEHHEIRRTFNIITSIGVSRELNRHRSHSICEESTRYNNYSKNKYGNELTCIIPEWLDIKPKTYDNLVLAKNKNNLDDESYSFIDTLLYIEGVYRHLANVNKTPAQKLRELLPLTLKTQVIHTAFESDWKEFIKLRSDAISGSVHPNMKVIANKIKELL